MQLNKEILATLETKDAKILLCLVAYLWNQVIWFNDMSNFDDYLIPNYIYIYICIYKKKWVEK